MLDAWTGVHFLFGISAQLLRVHAPEWLMACAAWEFLEPILGFTADPSLLNSGADVAAGMAGWGLAAWRTRPEAA